VDYACCARNKKKNGEENIVYNCNRSDLTGYKSSCTKRNVKSGGSIRIHGVCPSRFIVNISLDGSVNVQFVETHVGHDNEYELRSKRLTKQKRNIIVEEQIAGIPSNEIMMPSNFEERREIALEEFYREMCTVGRNLEENSFNKLLEDLRKVITNSIEKQENASKKRKIEEELYFPNKK